MSDLYDVNSSCLRYVVPFKYEEPFEEALTKVENQQEEKSTQDKKTGETKIKEKILWERKKATLDGPESDLYAYVRNEIRFEDDSETLSENKIGCEWILRGSEASSEKNGHGIKQLLYYPDGLKKNKNNKEEKWDIPEGMNISISNVGLLLFRNGLGFFWYEIKLPQEGFNSNLLKSFQNVIRELNRGDESLLWEKQKSKPNYGMVISENNGYKTYISPFSFGHWVNESIHFINVSYMAERKNAFSNMIKKSMAGLKEVRNEIVCLQKDSDKDGANLPDKAILFTYVSFAASDTNDSVENKYSLIFHIANGYKDSYHLSDEVSEEIKRPFDDAYWYATQEGAAYLVWPGFDNKEVFDSLIPSKVRTDYFALYLKTLYQSFSLLIYAEKIQAEISAVNGKYLVEPLDKRITELFGEINLFLTKSMATSVSHIHHQSEFYVYLKKQLRIHEDVKSVTAGLNALDILQREQRKREESKRVQEAWQEEQRRDREAQAERVAREEREKKSDGKIQAIMGLFALLGISSALVDCFDFIGKFDPKNGDFWDLVCSTQGWEIAFFVVIGIISVIAIVVSVKAIVDAFRNRD